MAIPTTLLFRRPSLVAFFFLLISVAMTSAQVLLLDVSSSGGTTTYGANVAPYASSATDLWNRGGTTNWGTSLQYTDGSAATDVRIVVDGLSNLTPGTAQYNYAAPAVDGVAGTGTPSGLFSNLPVRDAVHMSVASNVGYGGQSMRVLGLEYGTYDVYVVAAYVGSSVNPRPGQSSPASYNIWAFGGAQTDTLQTGTFGASMELLENSNNLTWTEGNNFARLTVTIDELNPTLYIVSEGHANDNRRGWLNAVQIVTVPEPATGLLAAAMGGALFLRRRKRTAKG